MNKPKSLLIFGSLVKLLFEQFKYLGALYPPGVLQKIIFLILFFEQSNSASFSTLLKSRFVRLLFEQSRYTLLFDSLILILLRLLFEKSIYKPMLIVGILKSKSTCSSLLFEKSSVKVSIGSTSFKVLTKSIFSRLLFEQFK